MSARRFEPKGRAMGSASPDDVAPLVAAPVASADMNAPPLQKGEGPGDSGAKPSKTALQTTNVEIVEVGMGDRKRFATIQAELAIKGYGLTELSGGGFFIHRWNLSRHVADLRGAANFLRQIGGAA